jgi:hypothetical protein
MINSYNDPKLLSFYQNKELWNGCFGGMSIVTHDHLSKVNAKYDISKLIPHINCRHNRRSFERVIGCLLQANYTDDDTQVDRPNSLFGDIHDYQVYAINFDQIGYYSHLPIIKCWTGR